MAWTPKQKIIRPRNIATNLLEFFEANQADAILWANNNVAIKPIAEFATSVSQRNVPVFPSISFKSDDDTQILGKDVIDGAYKVSFEIVVQSAHAAVAIQEAIVYEAVVKSMLANCPQFELLNGTGAQPDTGIVQELKSEFEEMRGSKTRNSFYQYVTVQAGITYKASAYE